MKPTFNLITKPQAATKENDKLANMITFISFTTKKLELMLQNKFYNDNYSVKDFEAIQEKAKNITLDGMSKLTDTTNLTLTEELTRAKKEITELREELDVTNQHNVDLHIKVEKLSDYEKDCKKAMQYLQEYVDLVAWHEKLLTALNDHVETSIFCKIQRLFKLQTLTNAFDLFIHNNPIPSVWDFNLNKRVDKK